eukprot:scaffold272530_cov22-Tisochrysis_lutea.AAC.1
MAAKATNDNSAKEGWCASESNGFPTCSSFPWFGCPLVNEYQLWLMSAWPPIYTMAACVDTAQAARVDTAQAVHADTARADTTRVDTAHFGAAQAAHVDTAHVDAAQAARVDTARAGTAQAARVDTARVDTAHVDTAHILHRCPGHFPVGVSRQLVVSRWPQAAEPTHILSICPESMDYYLASS